MYPPVRAIAAGRLHTVALTEDGKVVAWGDNGSGQCAAPKDPNGHRRNTGELYDKNHGQCAAPKEDLPPIKAVAVGGWRTVALTEDGKVFAWGGNGHGQCDVPQDLPPTKTVAAGDNDGQSATQTD